jgi:hypothetical protein
VRVEQQQPASPPPARQPAEPGWPEQPSRQGGQYGSPGGYGSGQPATAPYGSQPASGQPATAPYGSQPGYGQPGAGPSGPGNYDPASYGQSGYSGQGPGGQQLPPGRARRKRRRSKRRRFTMAGFIVLVVLILLVIFDQVGKAVAENQIASQITSADAQIHPSISIKEGLGDPFLGQIITRDLKELDISASNVSVPGSPVTITSVSAQAKGIHINGSFNGGKVDSITATVFLAYSSLSNALSSESSGIASLTLTSAGNGELKASFGIAGANLLTETGKITLKGNQVSIVWVSSGSGGDGNPIGDIIGGLAGGGSGGSGTLPNLSFTIPKLPAGVQITGFTVGSQGITIMGGAHNTTLSQ